MASQVALLAGLCVILAASTGTECRAFYGSEHPGFHGPSERSLDMISPRPFPIPQAAGAPSATQGGSQSSTCEDEDEEKAPELVIGVLVIETVSSDAEHTGEHKTGGEEGGKQSGAGKEGLAGKTDVQPNNDKSGEAGGAKVNNGKQTSSGGQQTGQDDKTASKTGEKQKDGSGKQASAVQQDGSKTQSQLTSTKPAGDGKTQETQQSAPPTGKASDEKNNGKDTAKSSSSSAPKEDAKSQKAEETAKTA